MTLILKLLDQSSCKRAKELLNEVVEKLKERELREQEEAEYKARCKQLTKNPEDDRFIEPPTKYRCETICECFGCPEGKPENQAPARKRPRR